MSVSIRRQLARRLLAVVLVLLGAGLSAIYLASRRTALAEFDATLDAKAQAVSSVTVQEEDGDVRVDLSDRFFQGFEDHVMTDFFELRDASGKILARSESLYHPDGLLAPVGCGGVTPMRWDLTLPTGHAGRAVRFDFLPPIEGTELPERLGEPVRLVVASDRAHLDEGLWRFLAWLLAGGGLLAGLMLWLVPGVLRHGLRPLERLGEQAGRIDASALGEGARFPVDGLPVELQSIARRLNDLLGRLGESLARERRFSANLAHELRTPLAELRSLAECAIKWPDARDGAMDHEVLAIARHMETLATHLLALARGEQGRFEPALEEVDLAAEAGSVWASFAGRARERGLEVSLVLPSARVTADRQLLRLILVNLFENAVEYASDAGRIEVRVDAADPGGSAACLRVGNSTSNLTGTEVAHFFDRLWRKEEARSKQQHLGLGLSLARAQAGAMRWTLTVALDEATGWLEFRLGPEAAE
ncbi:sensor histidine kinase N-terminal domain-containing protein [Termitidicoccus mucosus]|uniref:histidine kinase n=1 Tax=Termitidicoccus mucosus TaxID=1184151 RepID=A0A178IDX0_9BACT|nr:hypothetical protein AW736_18330 [Opitutaceae bacterium TSB47]